MAEITADLLHRPARETARLLALDWLDEASDALERLEDPEDAEALHDFRVSVRRLRSTLRAYRPHLKGSAPRKMRRRLGELASATNAGRDAEVQIGWLRPRAERLDADERAGAEGLLTGLEERKDRSYADARRRIAEEFRALRTELIERLTSYRAEVRRPQDAQESFLHVTAGLVREHADQLKGSLSRVRTAEDEADAHRARIAAKRLRYLLEPMQRSMPGVKKLVKPLKALQDLLGDLHDTHVLAGELALALEAAAARRARRLHELTLRSNGSDGAGAGPDETAGLLELTRELAERRASLFGRLRDGWLDDAAARFFQRVSDLAASFAQVSPPGSRLERRFLLKGVPARLRGERGRLIEQGWLPGDDIEERLQRVRAGRDVRYYRSVKTRSGRLRAELEERISRGTFRRMWPLTEGRRVRKRRYAIASGERVWEIDVFLDRELVLAEVRHADADVPEWLAPYVRREVSGKEEFDGRRLARRRSSANAD